jgi:putative ABC transport system ATP-binding protein
MGKIDIDNLQFRYPRSTFRLSIERLTIMPGSRVAIVGPSGSGKTTLLNLVSGITAADTGTITVGEIDVTRLSDTARRNFRIANIGMVFQQFELLEYLNVQQNILLPYFINPSLRLDSSIGQRAKQLAHSMGIADKLNRNVEQLSQGERQRVAVCRALMTEPPYLFADEPTGNLDSRNKRHLIDLLFEQSRIHQSTLVVVTHDQAILDGFDQVIDFETLLKEAVA